MRVISSGGMTCRRPSTNLAPPVPPVSTQIMRPPFVLVLRGLRHHAQPEVFPKAIQVSAIQVSRLAPAGIQDRPAGAGATVVPYSRCASGVAPDAARVF